MTQRYVLMVDGKTPLEEPDLLVWGRWLENDEARWVAHTQVEDVQVSTVFLGLNHRFWGEGPPILWETMIFGGPHDRYQERYTSYAKAVKGHQRAVKLVKDSYRPLLPFEER